MSNREEKRQSIENFILFNVREHPQDIVQFTAKEFSLSRQAILRYVRDLISQKLINVMGTTRNRTYGVLPILEKEYSFSLEDTLEEDIIWRKNVFPALEHFADNIVDICQYGLTEIVNNAIEHSEGISMTVSLTIYRDQIQMVVRDDGVGIFQKIQRECNLDDPLHAILELSKGKLTTDPTAHTGEGIFFTSRMFDKFFIWSHKNAFTHQEVVSHIDLMTEGNAFREGTTVIMIISPRSDRTIQSVFNKFSSDPDGLSFDKTIVPVELVRYGRENLVSRSQARRLLARFERFKEVALDFTDVEMIGQAFADEVFRVFVNAHPDIKIHSLNVSDVIQKMIQRVENMQ